MAVTIYEIPKLVLELSLESGGDLPDATTYYFIGFYRLERGYYGHSAGAASDEVSITTTAPNQRIKAAWKYWDTDLGDYVYGIPPWMDGISGAADGVTLKWDNYSMLDGEGVPYKWCNINDPAISSEFQDWQYGHRKWTINYASQGHTGLSVYLTSGNLYTTYWGTHNHTQLSWQRDRWNIYTNINMDASDLVVLIDGTGNTRDDLFRALIESGYFDRFELHNDRLVYDQTFTALLSIKGAFYGTGDLTMEYVHLNLIGCANHNKSITFDKCNIHMTPLGFYFWVNVKGNYLGSQLLMGGSSMIFGDIGTTEGFRPMYRGGFSTYGSYDGMTFLGSGGSTQFRYPRSTDYMKDVVLINTYLYTTSENSTHDYTMQLENISIESSETREIYHNNGYWSAGEVFRDRFIIKGLKAVNQANGIARVYFYNPAAGADVETIFEVSQKLSLKITDKNGDIAPNLPVLIEDSQGTTYNLVTDAGGLLSEWLECYKVEFDMGDADGYGDRTKTTVYNNFILTIDAEGFDKYVQEFALTQEEDWEIAIKQTDPPIYFERAFVGSIEADKTAGQVADPLGVAGRVETLKLTGKIIAE